MISAKIRLLLSEGTKRLAAGDRFVSSLLAACCPQGGKSLTVCYWTPDHRWKFVFLILDPTDPSEVARWI